MQVRVGGEQGIPSCMSPEGGMAFEKRDRSGLDVAKESSEQSSFPPWSWGIWKYKHENTVSTWEGYVRVISSGNSHVFTKARGGRDVGRRGWGYRRVSQSEQESTLMASGSHPTVSTHTCVGVWVYIPCISRPPISLCHLQSSSSYCLLPLWDIFTAGSRWLKEPHLLNGNIGPPVKWHLTFQLNFQIHLSICSWWVVPPRAHTVSVLSIIPRTARS